MIVEHLTGYFADFGESATWKTTPVTVIFNNAFQVAAGIVESTDPAITVQASEVPGVAHGDQVSLRSVAYTVCGVDPDSTGALVVLQLEKV